jgi:metallo-beta-lactamase family protein
LFVGHQSEGTVGSALISGAKQVRLFGETIQVAARIEQVAGISGHADQPMLLKWLKGMTHRPERVFVNHGEDSVCDTFAKRITDELHIPAAAPYNGAIYDTGADRWETEGNRARIVREKGKQRNTVYDRLLAAGERLMAVIRRNKEGTNKDLARFADQVTSLCDKWDQ